ncbi:hypothetical protein KR044_003017 [Drosophila immigrans]|nr:hypothetical protein KR044_003017 [Drosophila immigrans]
MPDGRIVGGETTNIREYPHQVSMRYRGNHRCGGSILNSNVIVSAAHCVNTLTSVANLTIFIGINNIFFPEGQELPVRKFIIHENYRTLNNDYDVALLFLDGDIKYNEAAQPIALATERPENDTVVTVTGWGTTTEGGYLAAELQKVNVNVVDNSACKSAYPIMLTSRMLCGGVTGGGKDACQGDSGGPLIFNNTLLGIVSWGSGCARPTKPGVYAAVPQLRPWIVETAEHSGGVVSKVAAFRNHEGYNANTMVNDIAVIRLSSSLSFSSNIKSIGLASSNPGNGASASVSGWGTQSSGSSSIPSQLQFINTKIVSQSVCASSAYSYGSQIRSSMICAAASGKDSCQGDSGGPLVSGGVLVGVVSWGIGCAYSNYPGVYASVADLRSWVVSAAKNV